MSQDIGPCEDLREYTSFAAQIDLTSASAGSPLARTARYIKIVDAGSQTLAVKLTGSNGTTRTFTACLNGDEFVGLFTTIEATTDVSKLIVGW